MAAPTPGLRTTAQLLAAGLVDPAAAAALDQVAARFAVAIPPTLAALITNQDDPIGRQFIPHPDELITSPGESEDPIGDDANSPLPGIVHRYPDRVLLKPLLICPTYCRFCFRRTHVGPDGGALTPDQLDRAIAYIDASPGVREVILTGGDPLMLAPHRLAALLARLAALPQIELLRIHTRVPIATPERLDPAMAAAIGAIAKPVFLVVHANHASEVTPQAAAALARARLAGIPLLSQTVLLRGVNDSAEALAALFRALLAQRVKPYYLHQLDPAPGVARFAVPIAEGQALLASLRGRLSGLAFPIHVFDTPSGKVPIGPPRA